MSFEPLGDDHQPASSEVFLDTSIHCSCLKGKLYTDPIERVLGMFQWKSTSTYTKLEYGNVVLAEATYLFNKIEELGSLDKLRGFIANALPHKYHAKKVTWSLNLLNVFCKDDGEATERTKLSLQTLISMGTTFVDAKTDEPLRDGTKCYWASRQARQASNGKLSWESPNCERGHRRCRVDDFFSENLEHFDKLKTSIDSLPPEELTDQLKSFSEIIAKAKDDPGLLLDYSTGCKKLADAIIAIDSLGYQSMFSQNQKESEILTEALGQDFYYLPGNPSLRPVTLKTSTSTEAS